MTTIIVATVLAIIMITGVTVWVNVSFARSFDRAEERYRTGNFNLPPLHGGYRPRSHGGRATMTSPPTPPRGKGAGS